MQAEATQSLNHYVIVVPFGCYGIIAPPPEGFRGREGRIVAMRPSDGFQGMILAFAARRRNGGRPIVSMGCFHFREGVDAKLETLIEASVNTFKTFEDISSVDGMLSLPKGITDTRPVFSAAPVMREALGDIPVRMSLVGSGKAILMVEEGRRIAEDSCPYRNLWPLIYREEFDARLGRYRAAPETACVPVFEGGGWHVGGGPIGKALGPIAGRGWIGTDLAFVHAHKSAHKIVELTTGAASASMLNRHFSFPSNELA